MSINYYTVQNFMSTYLSYGARMISDDGKCGFDTPEFSRRSRSTPASTRGGTHPDAPSMAGDTFRRGFARRQLRDDIQNREHGEADPGRRPAFADEIGIAKVPAGPANRSGFLGGWPLVLWDASQDKDAAAKWIMFATRPAARSGRSPMVSGFIPGSITLAQGRRGTPPPTRSSSSSSRRRGRTSIPTRRSPQMGQLEVDTIQKAIQAVALGQETVDQATTQLCADINEVLAR